MQLLEHDSGAIIINLSNIDAAAFGSLYVVAAACVAFDSMLFGLGTTGNAVQLHASLCACSYIHNVLEVHALTAMRVTDAHQLMTQLHPI